MYARRTEATAASDWPHSRRRKLPLRPAVVGLTGLLLCGLLAGATPSAGVILGPVDDTGHTAAPADDPGWHYVGRIGGLNVVYLGHGWVITARHAAVLVGMFDPERETPRVGLVGRGFLAVRGSSVHLQDSEGDRADLVLMRIEGDPGLPPLEVAHQGPRVGQPVVLIGQGRDRLAKLSFWSEDFAPAVAEHHRYAGFALAPETFTKRWGSNTVAAVDLTIGGPDGVATHAFATRFEPDPSSDQAQATTGDSGGAVFSRAKDGAWQLAGVLIAVTGPGEARQKAIFGSATLAADLSRYRAAILGHVKPPPR